MKEESLTEAELTSAAAGMLAQPEKLYDRAIAMMRSMVQYREMQMLYTCAIKEIKTKFDVLNTQFNVKYKRNPISSVSTRLKSTESLVKKMLSRGIPVSVENAEHNINDIAGVRVICSYIDDIYEIAEALLRQDDVKLIARKDYIEHPKPNGYRSLHLIVRIPVFFSDGKREVNVEVQIRTIAMDFWASLEHQITYKRELPAQDEVVARLKECADVIARTDAEMLELRRKIESAEDAPSEEEVLIEKIKRLDIQID